MATSRILQTMAFFLPIKVLIMMESTHPPSYFKFISSYISYEDFMLLLVVMVPMLYVSHFVMGVFHRKLLDQGVRALPDVIHKVNSVGSFGLKNIKKIYGHSVKCSSEIILFAICSMILFFISPWLFVIIFFVTVVNLMVFVRKAFYASEDDRITFFNLHRRQFVEYLASSNYLLVFLFLFIQMTLFEGEVYGAILALLLSRQIFQAMQRFSFENLHLSRMWKINSE